MENTYIHIPYYSDAMRDNTEKIVSREYRSTQETLQDLQGDEFLQLVRSTSLESLLGEANVTLLLPTNDAVEDFRHDLEQLNALPGGEVDQGPQYSVDDGLLSRRKRSLTVAEAPRLEDLLKNHVIDGRMDSRDLLQDERVLQTRAPGSSVRITVYNTYPTRTAMANCARLTSTDHPTADGSMVHVVDKMVLPATRPIADILASDVQFATFVGLLESAEMIEELGEEPGQLTVFAPTNRAFDRLDQATRYNRIAKLIF